MTQKIPNRDARTERLAWLVRRAAQLRAQHPGHEGCDLIIARIAQRHPDLVEEVLAGLNGVDR